MMYNPVYYPAVKYVRTAFVFALSILLSHTSVTGNDVPALGEYLAQADWYSEETWEHGEALAVLNEALEKYPDNDEILWRISRAYADSAEVLQKIEQRDEETIEKYYQIAKVYADRAIEINPENSMAYTQRAIATGQIALYKGIWSAIDLVKQTRDAVVKAIELDEHNDIAHFVYARTHAEVSERPRLFRRPLGLGWANVATALTHFDKALELAPDFILYRIDAAKVFIREKKYERARELLAVIPELEDQSLFDVTYRKEAEELFEKIKNK